MKINIQELRKSIAVRIVLGLLLANILAFAISSKYIQKDTTSENANRVENVSILETGWQVAHRSYSLMEFFKRNTGD